MRCHLKVFRDDGPGAPLAIGNSREHALPLYREQDDDVEIASSLQLAIAGNMRCHPAVGAQDTPYIAACNWQ